MNNTSPPSLETKLTLRDAYLTMFEYLRRYWESTGKPDEIGSMLGELSLWETQSGSKEPMDAAVFARWLSSARSVLEAQATSEGYRAADTLLNAKPPEIKVQR